MITQAQLKYFKSLALSKMRNQEQVYIVEGEKMAVEWLNNKEVKIVSILAVKDWILKHSTVIQKHSKANVYEITEKELERISQLKTPNKVFLEVKMPFRNESFSLTDSNEWTLALERVQDPGNMGTIIRIADWFGIKNIICSQDCADIYNPKVVQSTMGGLLRVNIQVVNDIVSFLSTQTAPLYVTDLNGIEISKNQPSLSPGIIVMGNESKGISEEVANMAQFRLKIPGNGGAESLNVGVATGIICYALLNS